MQNEVQHNQRKSKNREGLLYLVLGVAIGTVVPFFASAVELLREGNPVTLQGLEAEYLNVPLLMRVLAPFLLGGIAYFTWRRGMKVAREKERYLALLESQSKVLERQNESLTSLNESLDSLVYTTSHDLKTPVVNFLGLLRMLKVFRAKPGSEAQVDDIVDKMQVSADRMIKTIDDMLVVSRLESENEEASELLSIKETTEEVVGQLSDLLAEKGGEVSIVDEAAPQVIFSKTNLQALLQNLLANAFQFAHPDRRPKVKVSSRLKGERLAIEVQDNGIGIDLKANESKMFGMFTRLHNQSAGSGIGLYIVKKIMDGAGGEVQVHSKLNSGTTFTLLFPKNYIPK